MPINNNILIHHSQSIGAVRNVDNIMILDYSTFKKNSLNGLKIINYQ